MNILHLKYAVEIARSGSINKASEALLIAQPNLSRALKELEGDLGITIFERTAKGMVPTHDGEEFIGYAGKILEQIDEVENMYKSGHSSKKKFSIAVSGASYISRAFAEFSAGIGAGSAELVYNETDTVKAIKSVANSDCNLGIIRYAEEYDKYFKEMLEEKGLYFEFITEFHNVLVFNEFCRLAQKESIELDDLKDYVEVSRGDPFVPTIFVSGMKKEGEQTASDRCILVFDRASQLDVLSENDEAFMWGEPIPADIAQMYGLVMRPCAKKNRIYKDALIYRKDYRLSELDKSFITSLCISKRQCMR